MRLASERLDLWLRGLKAAAYRDMVRLLQHPILLVANLLNPLIYFFVLGVGLNSIVSLPGSSANYSTFLIPGIMAQVVYMHALMSGLSVVWDRESGYLRELLAAPVGRSGVLAGKTLANAAQTILQLAVLAPLALAYGLYIGLYALILMLAAMLLLSASLTAAGAMLALRVRSPRGFQTLVHYLNFPLLYLSGVYFPVESAPRVVAIMCLCNPLTYCVDAIRRIVLPDTPVILPASLGASSHLNLVVDFAVLIAMILILTPVAAILFDRQEGLAPSQPRLTRRTLGNAFKRARGLLSRAQPEVSVSRQT